MCGYVDVGAFVAPPTLEGEGACLSLDMGAFAAPPRGAGGPMCACGCEASVAPPRGRRRTHVWICGYGSVRGSPHRGGRGRMLSLDVGAFAAPPTGREGTVVCEWMWEKLHFPHGGRRAHMWMCGCGEAFATLSTGQGEDACVNVWMCKRSRLHYGRGRGTDVCVWIWERLRLPNGGAGG